MIVLMSDDGRRCDERCYNAKRLGCSCVCGGVNHGLGLQHALGEEHDAEKIAVAEAEEEMDDA